MLVAKAFLLQFWSSAQSFLDSCMSTSHTNSILFETDRQALLVHYSREKNPVWQTCLKHTEFAGRWTQTQQLSLLTTKTGRSSQVHCSRGKLLHWQINMGVWACLMPSSCLCELSKLPNNGMVLLSTFYVESGPLWEKKKWWRSKEQEGARPT